MVVWLIEVCVLFTRLVQHAAALRRLTHRNIAAVYDAFAIENYTADGIDSGEQASSLGVYVVQVVTRSSVG